MIYVITAVHNRKDITVAFANQLKNQTYPEIRFVMVDDGSTDNTAEAVKEILPDTQIILGDGDLWWGGAMHKAYLWIKENAEKDAFVMLANDDSEFDRTYIERAVGILKDRPNSLLTGYGLSRQSGKQVDGAVNYDYKTLKDECEGLVSGNCASTRSLFFRASDFIKIGGFHPVLLPHYASDYEWTMRAHRKYGYSIYCDPTLKYYADEETTGFNAYANMTRKKVFSKRSVSNPFYKLSFIFLAVPPKYIPAALSCQIKRYISKIGLIRDIMRK